jgi:hypothetical protein
MDAGVLAELCARWQAVACRRLDRPAMARRQVSLPRHAANRHPMPCDATQCARVRMARSLTATVVCAVRSLTARLRLARSTRSPSSTGALRRSSARRLTGSSRCVHTRTRTHPRHRGHVQAHARTLAHTCTRWHAHALLHVGLRSKSTDGLRRVLEYALEYASHWYDSTPACVRASGSTWVYL